MGLRLQPGNAGKIGRVCMYEGCERNKLVAHTGLEPVISALRGQRVNQLHQCATVGTWGL
jgi:hypothetical protein